MTDRLRFFPGDLVTITGKHDVLWVSPDLGDPERVCYLSESDDMLVISVDRTFAFVLVNGTQGYVNLLVLKRASDAKA